MTLRLDFAATSDVGRIRKDNQDSGYAGPWLLTVCDGVGGAARGDIASSAAVQQLRQLDTRPADGQNEEQLLGLVSDALQRAHARIGALVADQPALNGTSTTATLTLFDGKRIAVGHVGDSRAYLLRDGQLSQITHDHTFVQTLIDEGRITEEESRTHPHKNLILRALDGSREVDPDLFIIELHPGDRLFLCSDGVCGFVSNERIGDILATGTPESAAVDLVQVSLDEGSTDNVTCVVADVLDDSGPPLSSGGNGPTDTAAMPAVGRGVLVGAAADLKRRGLFSDMAEMLRSHRTGDTGELPVMADAELPDDVIAADPEELRYALKAPRRHPFLRSILTLCVVIGLLWMGAAAGWTWSQKQWFIGEQDGRVTIYRGVNTTLVGVDLYEPHVTTDLAITDLAPVYQGQVAEGIHQNDLESAKDKVRNLNEEADRESEDGGSS